MDAGRDWSRRRRRGGDTGRFHCGCRPYRRGAGRLDQAVCSHHRCRGKNRDARFGGMPLPPVCSRANATTNTPIGLGGASLAEVAAQGGGIWASVVATREADDAALLARLSQAFDRMVRGGITTAEVKSGYGLTVDDELHHLGAAPAGSRFDATGTGDHLPRRARGTPRSRPGRRRPRSRPTPTWLAGR